DVNECTATPPKCSGTGQSCTNFPGAYRCNCISPRQQLNAVGSECIDVVASVQGGIKIINRVFEPEYNDINSAGYFAITQVIIIALEANYRNTRFGAIFVGIIITRIYPGSVGVDYVATFNNTNGVNNQNLQQELIETFNYTNNGTFLGDSDLKLSEETNKTKVAEVLTFQ
ncbi:fibulin-2 isoform X3, partial [Paramuricea clavata]